jgi:hypothetical protein
VCYLPTNECKDQLTFSLRERSSCTNSEDCENNEVCYLNTKVCRMNPNNFLNQYSSRNVSAILVTLKSLEPVSPWNPSTAQRQPLARYQMCNLNNWKATTCDYRLLIPPTGVFNLTVQPGGTALCLVTQLASCLLVLFSLGLEWGVIPWCLAGGVRGIVDQLGVLSCSMSATVMSTHALQSLLGTRPACGGGSSTLASTQPMYSHH